MSRFFIYRPIFATVISIVIVIAGAVSFFGLPIEKFPPITPPTVQVTAIYPGANARTVAETVAAPIEQAVNGVEGMIYMSSTSTNEGLYTLTVTFELGMDLDIASVLVQNLVGSAEASLPQEVRAQGVTTKKRSTQTLQFLALTSPGGSRDGLFLSNFSLDIRDEISRVKGVGDVQTFGDGDYSMRVWLDPRRLKLRGLTTQDVVSVIQEQNVQVAAGQIGAPPAESGTAFQFSVNTQGRFNTVEQFENIIVRAGENGEVLHLGDLARVELGAESYTYSSTYTEDNAATLAIYQLPGANALETADAIRRKMDELRSAANWPDDVEAEVAYDATAFVTASISEVYKTLGTAVVLVVLVIFIFLQDWRATIVPVVAIPVSLIGTFAIMSGIGFSLNMLSLFGIVLAIGIVVDDAIVVVENVSRHIADGLSSRDAAVKAMSEITGPVIATTLVLLAVFVPCAFMPGITGELFRQFALTISASVIISTINALTLSPALCAIFLRPPKEASFVGFKLFNRFFERTTSVYGSAVTRLVRLTFIVSVASIALVGATGWILTQLPTGFVPDEDQGVLFVNVQLPDAASKERTDEVIHSLDEVFRETPGVRDWLSITGYSLLGGNGGSNVGFSVLILKPWDERDPEAESVVAIQQRLQKEFAKEKRAILFTFSPPPIDGLGTAGGFQMEVQDRGSNGYLALQNATEELVANASGQSSLAALNTSFRATVPQLYVDVDRAKAKTMDVPLSGVFATLQASLGSAYINDFTLNNRSYQVRVQAESPFRRKSEDITQLDVRDNSGNMIPLGSIVTVRDDYGPDVVRRYNMYPSAAVNGSAAPGISSGTALTLMEQTATQTLPASFSYEWTGMSFQEKQASGGQYFIFALAILFVFLVLAAQYESWTSPAAVIAVVPLAALGVALSLMLRGSDNNTYTQIGIVLLVALASKNAILIVEFASEQRDAGLSPRDAATEAAKLRFRAILMTAFSSILGFLPLLVATGAGAASRQAVGTAVVGGMVAATIFALLLVPTFFVVFRTLSEWFSPKPDAESND
ncbi:efflux RND transporter permease subunit [Rhodopirellula halodulae]|uniref:efflux RND transporter permease subunit n=1 Tax=Rhodopirellula halodulae TaxID=2894198 RepID=UPI001E5FE5F8|nr:multidrug efflux RND transporter permease subunit [Rhodopirellula sp. JC737]MCC9656767.1 multidrug efflux RND transporter permease subunit [Rhodopirellula sp. JC737]